MKLYQLITIISESADEKEITTISKKIQELLKQKAKFESYNDLGRKKLAYQIKKNQFGSYLVFKFSAEAADLAGINSELKTNPKIIRFMIVSSPVKIEPVKNPKKLIKKTEDVKIEKEIKPVEKPAPEKVTEPVKSIAPAKIVKPALKIKKEKKPPKPEITQEMESEKERMKKIEEELDKILEE